MCQYLLVTIKYKNLLEHTDKIMEMYYQIYKLYNILFLYYTVMLHIQLIINENI